MDSISLGPEDRRMPHKPMVLMTHNTLYDFSLLCFIWLFILNIIKYSNYYYPGVEHKCSKHTCIKTADTLHLA